MWYLLWFILRIHSVICGAGYSWKPKPTANWSNIVYPDHILSVFNNNPYPLIVFEIILTVKVEEQRVRRNRWYCSVCLPYDFSWNYSLPIQNMTMLGAQQEWGIVFDYANQTYYVWPTVRCNINQIDKGRTVMRIRADKREFEIIPPVSPGTKTTFTEGPDYEHFGRQYNFSGSWDI